MKSNTYSFEYKASLFLLIYYIVTFNPMHYYGSNLFGSIQSILISPVFWMISSYITAYCVVKLTKYLLNENDKILSDKVTKVYWSIWGISIISIYYGYYSEMYSYSSFLSDLFSFDGIFIQMLGIVVPIIQMLLLIGTYNMVSDKKGLKLLVLIFTSGLSLGVIKRVFSYARMYDLSGHFIIEIVYFALNIATFYLLMKLFKDLDTEEKKKSVNKFREFNYYNADEYSESDKENMCDRCNYLIEDKCWSDASLFSGKLECPNCGLNYTMKSDRNIIVKFLCILIPMLLISNPIIKYPLMIISIMYASGLTNKNWYVATDYDKKEFGN